MLSFVICDDNLNIARRLKEMLETLFIKNDIDAEVALITDNPNKVLEYVQVNSVDVLILDINLNSKISGIDVAKQIREKNKEIYIIFSTGHLEYSLLAYSVKTFDYLPKPVTLERLEFTIKRLVEDTNTVLNKYIKINNKTIISEAEINYIKKDGMKLIFCTNSGEYEAYNSFNKFEEELSDNFVRCHKSFIANAKNIINVNASDNLVVFNNKSTCDIGPKYKNNLLKYFDNII